MKQTINNYLINPKYWPIIGLSSGVLFWVVDSINDVFLFNESTNLKETLFNPGADEITERLFIAFLFIVFSFFLKRLRTKQIATNQELITYKCQLESLVKIRTKKLEHLATIDPLTSLLNRREIDSIIDKEIDSSLLDIQPKFYLLFCDIDFFKNINDSYGHDIGDTVLKQFAQTLQEALKQNSTIARWGGEEFVILVKNNPTLDIEKLAEYIRITIQDKVFTQKIKLTVSIGITQYKQKDTRTSLLKRADKALYAAKNNKRNCIAVMV